MSKRAEAEARKLDRQLKFVRKGKFGDKRQKARKDVRKEEDADREDEKDRFDGTGGTLSTGSVGESPVREAPVTEEKVRDLTAVRINTTRCLLKAPLSSILQTTPRFPAG